MAARPRGYSQLLAYGSGATNLSNPLCARDVRLACTLHDMATCELITIRTAMGGCVSDCAGPKQGRC
eukprot:100947-Lingulodinium_polyedra.AAC.1